MATKNIIALKGSAQMISEFMDFGINSIIFLRHVYDGFDFRPVEKYGLTVYMAQDEYLRKYLNKVLDQVRSWVEVKKVLGRKNVFFYLKIC